MLFRSPDEYRIQKRSMASTSTEELIAMWGQTNLEESKRMIVQDLLLERGEDIPALSLKAKYKESRLPVESNVSIRVQQSGKIEFKFPKDGFMTHGRFQFENNDDLIHYFAESFGLNSRRPPTRGRASRRGKYRRVDAEGKPIFTFGDPFLDLVTNKHGILVVGEEVYDLKTAMIRSKNRRGGILSCDVTPYIEDMFRMNLSHALTGCNKFAVLECGEDGGILASTNPADVMIKVGNTLTHFHAWRTNFVYWSLGASIDTSGGNFSTATIVGRYAEQFQSPHCFVTLVDADTDLNDNYVDEMEWGVVPCSTPYDGVRSLCTVNIKGNSAQETVEAGNCNTIN
jgi:hypothetical protein